MKGRQATGQAEVTEFVIVNESDYAWSAPRGPHAKWLNGWVKNKWDVEIYQSWQAASKAIDRYRAKGRAEFTHAKYCTLKEFLEMIDFQ